MTVATRPWASVVIPIKDERDNLVPLTEQLVKVLDGRDESRSAPFELIFIDEPEQLEHALNRVSFRGKREVFSDRHSEDETAPFAIFRNERETVCDGIFG